MLLLEEIEGILRRLFKVEENWGVLRRRDNPDFGNKKLHKVID